MCGIEKTGMKLMQLAATYEVILIFVSPHLPGVLPYSTGHVSFLSPVWEIALKRGNTCRRIW